jgi:hypothetical protein
MSERRDTLLSRLDYTPLSPRASRPATPQNLGLRSPSSRERELPIHSRSVNTQGSNSLLSARGSSPNGASNFSRPRSGLFRTPLGDATSLVGEGIQSPSSSSYIPSIRSPLQSNFQEEEENEQSSLLLIGIDFGTT